ncbi:LuxR C-terminal-related transcriptional regulator [Gaopeijia maritima]|uniref:LuxR C-terminal-related transcriptional regulator n=1 Tax=Gaopeijia maritima TaxID=3119007 RepID=UPI00328A8986
MKRDDVREVLQRLERGDSASAQSRIRIALDGDGERDGERASEDSASVRATLEAVVAAGAALREGRVDDLVREAGRAAQIAPPIPEVQLRVGSVLQGAFRFTGDPALEVLALDTLSRVADRVEQPDAAVLARALMGTVHLLSGAFHSCLELCDAALALAEVRPPRDAVGAALAHQFRGYVLFEWNRLREAEEALTTAWESSEGAAGVRSGVARMLASLAAARADDAAMEHWFGALTVTVAEPLTLRNREWLGAVRARATLGRGDLRDIDAWLRAFGYGDAVAARPDSWIASRLHELEGALTLLEATGQWARADALAARMIEAAAGRRRWFEARAASVQAVAGEAAGRPATAERHWERALEAGRTGSFVRAYLEGDPRRHRALARLADAGHVEAARVLAEGAAQARTHPDPNSSPLTERQTEVLRLVERGLSNKAIGRDLDLSVSTVKTHLRDAFTRLGASSRTEAVALSRDRGWLPTLPR